MNVSHSIALARVHIIRSWRRLFGTRLARVLLGIGLFVYGLLLIGSLQSMYVVGTQSTSVQPTAVVPILQQLLAGTFVLAVILVAIRTMQRLSRITAKEFVLTTVSTRTAVLGILLAECCRLCLPLGVLVGAYTAAFVLGSGSYLSLVMIPVATIPVLVAAVLAGYLVGLLARTVAVQLFRGSLLQYAFVALGIVLISFVVQPILVTVGVLEAPIIEVSTPLVLFDGSPFDAYVHLFLVGSPVATALTVETVAVAAVLIGSIPLLFEASARLADRLWYRDSGDSERATGNGTPQKSQPPRGFPANNSLWMALAIWRRNLRRPRYFISHSYLVFLFGLAALRLLSNPDDFFRYGPVLVAIFGAVLSGSLFAIMPPESDKEILSLVLTTPRGSRLLAHGRVVAGLLLGLPVIVGGVLIVGLLGRWGGVWILVAVIFGSILAGTSTALALALGAFSPSVLGNLSIGDETITANPVADGVHTVGITILGILGFAFLLAPEFFQSTLGITRWSQTTISFGGIGLFTGMLILLTGVCYRYALREYNSLLP